MHSNYKIIPIEKIFAVRDDNDNYYGRFIYQHHNKQIIRESGERISPTFQAALKAVIARQAKGATE